MAQRKKAASKISFGEAVGEVEQILARLEAEEIDIDDLSTEVRRAVELIGVCRAKLEKTDAEVRDLVADLQDEAPAGSAETAPEAVPDDAADENLPF